MSAQQGKLGEIIDIRGVEAAGAGGLSTLLAKTGALEVRRLSLPRGREIPAHRAPGEITVHCLAGRIRFASDGEERELGPGQMILVAAGEPHSLVALEDATVLVTKVLAAASPGR